MKKRIRNSLTLVFIIIIVISICLVSAQGTGDGKNIFQKAWGNIKGSYLKISGKVVAGCVKSCSASVSCGADDGCGGSCWCPTCGGCCGNGICEAHSGENCVNCLLDCPIENDPICGGTKHVCGDGVCNGEETCSSCSGDCGCPAGQTCSNGKCSGCKYSCNSVSKCGDSNGCGGRCRGLCSVPGFVCSSDNFCVCGNLCTKGEKKCLHWNFDLGKDDGNAYVYECSDKNKDWCNEFINPVKCDFGCLAEYNPKTGQNDFKKCAPCPNECKKGEKKCDENEPFKIKECYYNSTNKCYRWRNATTCPVGQACTKDIKDNKEKCMLCSPLSCEEYSSWADAFGQEICGEWSDKCGTKLSCGECEKGFDCFEGFCRKITCKNNSNCGVSGVFGDSYCGENGWLYKTEKIFECKNPGTYDSFCTEKEIPSLYHSCSWPLYGCIDNRCSNKKCRLDSDCVWKTNISVCKKAFCDTKTGRCGIQAIPLCEYKECPRCNNDFNSCNKDLCKKPEDVNESCVHICSGDNISKNIGKTWAGVDWSDTGVKIWTIGELIKKFKDEELKKENGYNSDNIKNFDKIVEGDPELAAAIIYKELIIKNRLLFVIFYDGSKEVNQDYRKKVSDFIKVISNPRIQGKPITIVDNYETHEIKPQILLIDISCKKIDIFNKMQQLRNVADSKTYPAFSSIYYRMVEAEVAKNEQLKKMYAGKVFQNGLSPLMPLSEETIGNTPNIGIAAYTNLFGNIMTYVPNSDSWFEFLKFEWIVSFTFFGKEDFSKADSYYNIARLGIGPKKTEERIKNLEDKIQVKINKLKTKIQPKDISC